MEDNATVEESRQQANKREEEERAKEQRRTALLHQENVSLWREHFRKMALNHHDLAAEYAAKADALNGGGAA